MVAFFALTLEATEQSETCYLFFLKQTSGSVLNVFVTSCVSSNIDSRIKVSVILIL